MAELNMGFSGTNSLHCKEDVKFSYDLFFLFVCFVQTAAVVSLTQGPLATQQLLIQTVRLEM